MDNDNNEKVNPKSYIKKGFWISLGAVGGIGIIAIGIIGIGELPTFIGNIPTAYKVLTQKDSEYCNNRFCKTNLQQRLYEAYAVFVLCRKDNICMWK
jgi:hypothetical protein